MAIKMDKHTLAYLNGLLKRGGKATLGLGGRVVIAEVVKGEIELSYTECHPDNWDKGPVDYRIGDEVVDTEAAEKEIEKAKKTTKKTAAKKTTKKKPAAKKKK